MADFCTAVLTTTGEQWGYYVLDDDPVPRETNLPETLRPSVDLIVENCEPALCTVLFMGGAVGSLRSGVTRNPVRLTRSVQGMQTIVTCGGAPTHISRTGGDCTCITGRST